MPLMRRSARSLLAVLAAAVSSTIALAACDSGPASRCAQICELEARCADVNRPEGDKPRFDTGECTSACKALERDDEGKKLVNKHADCVRQHASDCAAVLACP
jgi:hypothetical protein